MGKNFHTQTDTWHPDWLSRASQHARGATKNNHHATVEQFETVKVQRNFRQFCGDLRLECGRRRFLGPPPTLPCIWHELQPTQRSVDSTHNIVVHASSKTTTTTTWHTRACRVSIWNFRRVPEDALDYAATRRRDRTVTGREYSTPKSFSTCAKDPVFLTLLLILSFDIFFVIHSRSVLCTRTFIVCNQHTAPAQQKTKVRTFLKIVEANGKSQGVARSA